MFAVLLASSGGNSWETYVRELHKDGGLGSHDVILVTDWFLMMSKSQSALRPVYIQRDGSISLSCFRVFYRFVLSSLPWKAVRPIEAGGLFSNMASFPLHGRRHLEILIRLLLGLKSQRLAEGKPIYR